MNNGPVNPLTAPLTMIKQVGEQASATISSLGTGMTQAASQGLDSIISGVPVLPGMPGVTPGARALTPQSLMPANLQQALGQVENLLIPPGLPRPSQALGLPRVTPPTPQPQPTPQPSAGAETPPAMAQRRRIAERRGL